MDEFVAMWRPIFVTGEDGGLANAVKNKIFATAVDSEVNDAIIRLPAAGRIEWMWGVGRWDDVL